MKKASILLLSLCMASLPALASEQPRARVLARAIVREEIIKEFRIRRITQAPLTQTEINQVVDQVLAHPHVQKSIARLEQLLAEYPGEEARLLSEFKKMVQSVLVRG